MSFSKELEVISLTKKERFLKRSLDLFLSFFLLLFFIAPILVLILLSSIDTGVFGLFTQNRIGLNGNCFTIFKIRTISLNGKISKFGFFLRKSKLDELTQLVNILIGNMSFVGPRPDLVGFADKLKGEDRIILSVKPGLTGPASLFFFDEEILLSKVDNPKEYSEKILWYKKLEMNKLYIKNYHFFKDLEYINKTIINVSKNMVI